MLGLVLSVGVIVWIGFACFAFYDGDLIQIRLTAEHTVNGIAFLLLMLTLYLLYLAHKNNEDLYGNFATSIGSIAITVILIDRLNAWRVLQQRKQEIFEEIESPVRDVAVEAIRLVRKYGWLNEAVQKVDFTRVQLAGVDFCDANLTLVDFRGADLRGALFIAANLQDTKFEHANLQGAKLPDANLQGARLIITNLRGANLINANLQKAILINANLQGANLWNANLQGAVYSHSTIWPKDFDLKIAKVILVEVHG